MPAPKSRGYGEIGYKGAVNEPPQNRLSEVQYQRNRKTRGDWDAYTSHREHTTSLILEAAGERDAPSLCLLGAGNGNDLDLTRLVDRFAEISLVDLDGEALGFCLSQLDPADANRVHCVSHIDLSGLMHLLPSLALESPDSERWQAAWKIAGAPPEARELGSFDVVVSTCLLTQMIDSVVTGLGDQHPSLAELVIRLREGHLKLIASLLSTEGSPLLTTDFVTSDTPPGSASLPDSELGIYLKSAIEQRNFFTGTNPAVIAQQFGVLAATGKRVIVRGPWRWSMGPRTYAVCGFAAVASE